jgi:sphingomyelin phosphodiesterase 2
VPGSELVVVSLNTRGVPAIGSGLPARYAVIGAGLERGDADVVCVQEVMSWWHLRLLARRMPGFPHVSCRRSPPGPAGGLVTFSRLPLSRTTYHAFGVPPKAPGISGWIRFRAALKGVLVTGLGPGLCVVNTHPLANRDGDWSPSGRFFPLHRAQLGSLAEVLRTVPGPAVVCGDFNIDRDSVLFAEFVDGTGLSDAFGGTCPPTFRAEYLPQGASPHCIDFILTTADVKATSAGMVFADKEPLPGGPGWVSDHVGLSASLSVAS